MDSILTPEQKRLINAAIDAGVPILITGEPGPTGKTTLCDELRRRGAVAWEPWEVDEGVIEPDDIAGENSMLLTVRLNKRVKVKLERSPYERHQHISFVEAK